MKLALSIAMLLITALIGKAAEDGRPGYLIVLAIADFCIIAAFWSACAPNL